jgi:SulP family sulfate permease
VLRRGAPGIGREALQRPPRRATRPVVSDDASMTRWGREALNRLSSPNGDVHTPASAAGATAATRRRLQVLSSLNGYKRAWATPDLLAALTLLVIAVPEQLATSRLAGMPPITGFYAFVAGTVLFALVGSNPQMSVGADSTIAPLFAVGILRLAPAGSPHYVDLVGILAVMVGVIVALIGLLRLGWIAQFLSAPIITGFLGGVAVIIVVHQLPDLFGIHSVSGSTLYRIKTVVAHLGDTNGWTLGIGVVVFAVVMATERIDRKLPGALVGLVGSTIVVGAAGLHAHGVAILGAIAHGAPRLGLFDLSWSAIASVAPIAGVVALVVVSQSAATTRAFADAGHYEVDVGRDFVGVGAGNIAAGLFGAFPVNASPARTAATASAGGRTQAAGLVAAAALIVLIPAAGLLKDVPLATLAAVLIFIATRIFHGRDLVSIARFDRFELGLAVITLLTVALVGVEQGIGVAVGLAILDRTRLSARPQVHVLGRIAGTTSWVPLSANSEAAQLPGVLAVLFATPLWYANAVHFRAQVVTSLGRAVGTPRLMVLDALGMSDLDYTGSRALAEILDELDDDHITFAVARAGQHAREGLRRSGLLARIGEDHLFPSVDEAVQALGSAAASAPDPGPQSH